MHQSRHGIPQRSERRIKYPTTLAIRTGRVKEESEGDGRGEEGGEGGVDSGLLAF